MSRRWHFYNDKFNALENFIKPEDLKDFSFGNYYKVDRRTFWFNSIIGGRRYLLREREDNLPKVRQKYKKYDQRLFLYKIINF